MVAGALKQQGIPHFIKEKGPGRVYCSGAIMGADLYVPGEFLETAMDIAEDVLFTQYRYLLPNFYHEHGRH